MAAQITGERNQDATVYVGNLEDRVSDALLWELMLQAGPVVNVHLPKDRVTQLHQGYGFVEFLTEDDADYAIKIMNMVKLYGKPLRVNKKATGNVRQMDVGANLFIGNLDPDVDEKLIYDTFSAFGIILQTPKVARDPDSGNSKGYGFVSFDNFESSDAAIEAMNGQYLANKPISVQYALKKDGKGERHGSAAERLLAAQAKKNAPSTMPHRMFADSPQRPGMPGMTGMQGTPGMPLPVMTNGVAGGPMSVRFNNPATTGPSAPVQQGGMHMSSSGSNNVPLGRTASYPPPMMGTPGVMPPRPPPLQGYAGGYMQGQPGMSAMGIRPPYGMPPQQPPYGSYAAPPPPSIS